MKLLQLLMGLSGSTLNYACVRCKVQDSDRGNLALPWDYYNGDSH